MISITLGNAIASSSSPSSDQIRAAAQFISQYRYVLDCENVGYVQTGEADEHFSPIFLAYDHDKSHSISRRELLNDPFIRNKELLAVTFKQMDRNGDGNASAHELLEYLNTAVGLIDGDGDGDVYPDEFTHALTTGTLLQQTSRKPRKTAAQPAFITPQVRLMRDILKRQAHSKKPREPSTGL